MSLDLNKIYNEDCLEGMKRIDDKSIDMILCDLPYGMTYNKWDTAIPLEELWKQYERIVKDNGAIVLTASQPFASELISSNRKLFRYEWIWEKENATGFLNAKKNPLRIHENILVFYKKLPIYNPQMRKGKPYTAVRKEKPSLNYYKNQKMTKTVSDGERYPISIIKFNRDKEKLHPTQKPVALFEYLIKTYTDEGEIVLDNCIGSGTTAVACINTNRNFIGFELDKGYFDIAKNRIEEEKNKLYNSNKNTSQKR